jgi:antitoxin (DNA-binding transcriptional repressor) of toxin-antitoxin stability system
MTSQEMTVEQARAKLGDLVIAAMRGEITIITRYGDPVAQIGPIVGQRPLSATEKYHDARSYGPPPKVTFTYAIEISDDGQIWMPESGAAVGTERTEASAEVFGAHVLDNWVADLPEDAKGGHRRIVVWKGEQQDAIDMAAAVITAD